MGGRSYYCDYCCCYLKNNLSVRKRHESGLSHSIAKYTYMRQFEDPYVVLMEENAKSPCIHFQRNICRFGLYCQHSHFSTADKQKLQKIVNTLQKKNNLKHAKSIASHNWRNILPWNVTATGNHRKAKLSKNLPPSLKAINFNILCKDLSNEEWGRM
ncbi:uncharacterized protein LOC119690261 [Teleopsis dalmanni]|uniref:uncharacterized protein LOC119690261 n=1 Tax=Teleopsis dalmanni TaxID=139649 RepID=UPI0018CF648E|nr:uncharacterized protein LOC119690261 [Teleopsis dalmanni]